MLLLYQGGAPRHSNRAELEIRLLTRFQTELKRWRTGELGDEKEKEKGEFEDFMAEQAAAESGIAHGAEGAVGGLSADSVPATTLPETSLTTSSTSTATTTSEVTVETLDSREVDSEEEDANLTVVQDEETPLSTTPVSREKPVSPKFPTVLKTSLPVSADKSVRPKEPPVIPPLGISREKGKHTFPVFKPSLPNVYSDPYRTDDSAFHRDYSYDPASFRDHGSVANYGAQPRLRISRETDRIGNYYDTSPRSKSAHVLSAERREPEFTSDSFQAMNRLQMELQLVRERTWMEEKQHERDLAAAHEYEQRQIRIMQEKARLDSERADKEAQRLADAEERRAVNARKKEEAKLAAELAKIKRRAEDITKREQSSKRKYFNYAGQVKMVPKFTPGGDLDEYFSAFEKTARRLEWPDHTWTTLLQTQLSGKCLKIYSALSDKDSSDYNILKARILEEHLEVAENYRQKYRNTKKDFAESFVEYGRRKEILCFKWLNAKKAFTADEIRNQLLLEEFINQCPFNVREFLSDKTFQTWHEAADLADKYVLFRSLRANSQGQGPNRGGGNASNNSSWKKGQNYSNTSKSDQGQNKGQPEKRYAGNNTYHSNSGNRGQGHFIKQGNMPNLSCAYCRKPGHLISDCWKLRNKNDSLKKGIQESSSPRTEGAFVIYGDSDSKVGRQPSVEVPDSFKCFTSKGKLSVVPKSGKEGIKVDLGSHSVTLIRDTCAEISLLRQGAVPMNLLHSLNKGVLIEGVLSHQDVVPLYSVNLVSDYSNGPVVLALVPTLPIPGVDLLIANDIGLDKVYVSPVVSVVPKVDLKTEKLESEFPGIFPACAVTRSQTKREPELLIPQQPLFTEKSPVDSTDVNISDDVDDSYSLENTFLMKCDKTDEGPVDVGQLQVKADRKTLVSRQKLDPSLTKLYSRVVDADRIESEAVCYFLHNEVLMRKWRDPIVPASKVWEVKEQICVPKCYRKEILSLAHDIPLAGHLGVRKTKDRILQSFYWPSISSDVAKFCRTCRTCQLVGKPNSSIGKAPLKPIPAVSEPFERIIIDIVGPLPRSKSGNKYLLTIMDQATRFPEAVPLKEFTASTVATALVKFFTLFGFPKELQSDQGSNFMSRLFQVLFYQLGVKQIKSTAYHPQTQGALERYHQVLKNMLKAFCLDHKEDWDEAIPMLLFATREVPVESLGVSSFNLIFGHRVRGPLQALKEIWLDVELPESNLIDYVSTFKERLYKALKTAHENLKQTQANMKDFYDQKSQNRSLEIGSKCLALLPIPGNPLKARFLGPYVVKEKLNDLDYVIETPDRRKSTQVCHINLLKPFYERDESVDKATVVLTKVSSRSQGHVQGQQSKESEMSPVIESDVFVNNSNCSPIFSGLTESQIYDLNRVFHLFPRVFSDQPGKTHVMCHEIDLIDTKPIKLHPYRMHPDKLKILEKEIIELLDIGVIEHSCSEYSSPVVMIPKPDGSQRVCIDYRKINAVTRPDSFPIPRIDDLIDKVSGAKYLTKIDLRKGYYQVPLAKAARPLTAFAVPGGLYQFKTMPFGLRNAPATFQRMMTRITEGMSRCATFIDDVCLYDSDWKMHVENVTELLRRLDKAGLTINLPKCEFGQAQITYLGHVVGRGKISPKECNVEAISKFERPTTRKEIKRFLGMAGFYRKFVENFSTIAEPITRLLKKDTRFNWTSQCQDSFEKIKLVLKNHPVLKAPEFDKPFSICTDASDVGAGAVLMQRDNFEVDKPVAYFSRKFNQCQRAYSTIEKECLALVWAIQQFKVYFGSNEIKVYTDHNPLVFLHRMKDNNQRVLRWALFLQQFSLLIEHIPGKCNIVADALSQQ